MGFHSHSRQVALSYHRTCLSPWSPLVTSLNSAQNNTSGWRRGSVSTLLLLGVPHFSDVPYSNLSLVFHPNFICGQRSHFQIWHHSSVQYFMTRHMTWKIGFLSYLVDPTESCVSSDSIVTCHRIWQNICGGVKWDEMESWGEKVTVVSSPSFSSLDGPSLYIWNGEPWTPCGRT